MVTHGNHGNPITHSYHISPWLHITHGNHGNHGNPITHSNHKSPRCQVLMVVSGVNGSEENTVIFSTTNSVIFSSTNTHMVSGVNGSEDNTVIFSTTTYEEREKWVKCIRRTVNRIIIDQNRVGDHTKLRKLLTEQEAEISILEEELEKMAAIAGECSSRSLHAEGKLAEREADCGSLTLKVDAASREVLSLKQQVAILEERAHNLTMLADDVGTASKEDVQAAKEKMAADRAARLKAIQLEVNGDEHLFSPPSNSLTTHPLPGLFGKLQEIPEPEKGPHSPKTRGKHVQCELPGSTQSISYDSGSSHRTQLIMIWEGVCQANALTTAIL
eukprot:sb/3466672/